jgi:hypothetical protein
MSSKFEKSQEHLLLDGSNYVSWCNSILDTLEAFDPILLSIVDASICPLNFDPFSFFLFFLRLQSASQILPVRFRCPHGSLGPATSPLLPNPNWPNSWNKSPLPRRTTALGRRSCPRQCHRYAALCTPSCRPGHAVLWTLPQGIAALDSLPHTRI